MSQSGRWPCVAAACCVVGAAQADAFSAAHYDPRTDQLVVTMVYGGTNPDHSFSLRWGKCQAPASGDEVYQVAAQVLDSQWSDAALHDYTKTVRFSLKGLQCRPAEVTLHTAPRYYYSVRIPKRSELRQDSAAKASA